MPPSAAPALEAGLRTLLQIASGTPRTPLMVSSRPVPSGAFRFSRHCAALFSNGWDRGSCCNSVERQPEIVLIPIHREDVAEIHLLGRKDIRQGINEMPLHLPL